MDWQFENDRPIYLQIAEKLSERIASGEFAPGEALPSVRDTAAEAAVNPNTVQKAMAELKSTGLILSQGTSGSSVTEDSALITSLKARLAHEIVRRAVTKLKAMKLSDGEISDIFDTSLGGTADENT